MSKFKISKNIVVNILIFVGVGVVLFTSVRLFLVYKYNTKVVGYRNEIAQSYELMTSSLNNADNPQEIEANRLNFENELDEFKAFLDNEWAPLGASEIKARNRKYLEFGYELSGLVSRISKDVANGKDLTELFDEYNFKKDQMNLIF